MSLTGFGKGPKDWGHSKWGMSYDMESRAGGKQ